MASLMHANLNYKWDLVYLPWLNIDSCWSWKQFSHIILLMISQSFPPSWADICMPSVGQRRVRLRDFSSAWPRSCLYLLHRLHMSEVYNLPFSNKATGAGNAKLTRSLSKSWCLQVSFMMVHVRYCLKTST